MNKTIFTVTTILLSVLHLNAQYKMTGVPPVKQDIIHSDIVGEDYYLQITLPLTFNPTENKYPVLFYLDAYGTSAGMNELAKRQMFAKNFNDVVLVGISYNTNPMNYNNLRTRDYSPPINSGDTKHGGDKFLEFIKLELIPYIESNYGTDPNDRGLMGASAGGLFAAWSFKQEPELFNKLAMISPALWYGGNDFILENHAFLENVKEAKDLQVFMSYGSLEGKEFISFGDKLYHSFKTNENILIEKVIFENEDHGSVINAASTRALYTFYQDQFKASVKKVDYLYYDKEYGKALKGYELIISKFPKEIDDGNKYDIACLYALTGDTDSAFRYLSQLDPNYRDWPEKMNRDTDLLSLHQDSRWKPLLDSLKKE